MSKIEVTPEKINEMMKGMNQENREIFQKLLITSISKKPTETLEKWLKEFSTTCPIDSLIAHILNDILINVGRAIHDDMNPGKSSSYSGRQAMIKASEQLKKIACEMDESIAECDEEHAINKSMN
jgi:uncharacterized protein YukE